MAKNKKLAADAVVAAPVVAAPVAPKAKTAKVADDAAVAVAVAEAKAKAAEAKATAKLATAKARAEAKLADHAWRKDALAAAHDKLRVLREAEAAKRRCLCGCGAQTPTAFFVPGHDAKLVSRWLTEAKQPKAA